MRFNRTFMELKLMVKKVEQTSIFRFNRTFMELKYMGIADDDIVMVVLIVPLWN